MIYMLMGMALFYILGIVIVRKERKLDKENFRAVKSVRKVPDRQMEFLKRKIVSSYILELVLWFIVGVFTAAIVEHFNS